MNYGYSTGRLSVVQKQGLITHSQKTNKCRYNLKDWRPMSLLNVVYKLASAAITNRLNIDNPYFEQMVGQIYPTELQINKANSSDTEALFFGLELVNNKWHSFLQNL